MQHVSADNITELTAALEFHGQPSIPAPPTVDELIASIEQSLQNETLGDETPGGPVTARARLLHRQRLLDRRRDFKELLNNVPEGFKLAPVFYVHTDPNQRMCLQTEYFDRVRGAFLRFLAENHTDELRSLGISEKGIRRMRDKEDPTDERGRYYALNIDHIVEQTTSGLWSREKKRDPLRRADVGPRYPVNHFSNLILLPDYIHQYKNRLNIIQKTFQIGADNPRWVLALVPERNDMQSGFVAAPQKIQSLPLRSGVASDKTAEANTILKKSLELFEAFNFSANIQAFNGFCAALPAEAGNDNDRQKKLSFAFNALVPPDSDTYRTVQKLLLPTVTQLAKALEKALNTARHVEKPKAISAVKSFGKFYQSRRMQLLRTNLFCLPFNEAAAARQVFDKIDSFMDGFQLSMAARSAVASKKATKKFKKK